MIQCGKLLLYVQTYLCYQVFSDDLVESCSIAIAQRCDGYFSACLKSRLYKGKAVVTQTRD